jgi:hypothetical protein
VSLNEGWCRVWGARGLTVVAFAICAELGPPLGLSVWVPLILLGQFGIHGFRCPACSKRFFFDDTRFLSMTEQLEASVRMYLSNRCAHCDEPLKMFTSKNTQ